MTRYKNKPLDDIVKLDDTILGSDAITGKSVNRTIKQLADTFGELISNVGLSFIYADTNNIEDENTPNYFTLDDDDLSLSTELRLNNNTINGYDVTNLLNSITPLLTDLKFQVKIEKTDDPSTFHYFKIDSITDNTTHFTLGITKSSNQTVGSLVDEAKYFIKIEPSSEGELNRPITDSTQTDDSNISASAKAVKTVDDRLILAEQSIQALDQAIILIGTWDASTGSFPSNTNAGYKYIVSADGTVDGIDFKIGDTLTSILDNASTTTYLANWHHQPLATESGFVQITWADLVTAHGNNETEAGQKYDITTANPDDGIIYGKVILTGTGGTFDYLHPSGQYAGFEQTIIID